jgi:hypothetical protein
VTVAIDCPSGRSELRKMREGLGERAKTGVLKKEMDKQLLNDLT